MFWNELNIFPHNMRCDDDGNEKSDEEREKIEFCEEGAGAVWKLDEND